jgi:hypothetical protein
VNAANHCADYEVKEKRSEDEKERSVHAGTNLHPNIVSVDPNPRVP